MRTALGAGRGRLLRQLVTESCVLTMLGAAVGLLLARVVGRYADRAEPGDVSELRHAGPRHCASPCSPIAVSLACGLLVGLAPGLQAHALDLNSCAEGISARGSDGRRSQRLRSALVVAELSLAVVLLVGAGPDDPLGPQSRGAESRLRSESVLTLHVSIPRPAPPAAGRCRAARHAPAPPARPVVEGRALLERLRAVPGVAAAALGNDLPLDGDGGAAFYAAEGQPPVNAQNVPRAYVHRVSPDFFSTLRIPIVSGRTFTDAETDRHVAGGRSSASASSSGSGRDRIRSASA